MNKYFTANGAKIASMEKYFFDGSIYLPVIYIVNYLSNSFDGFIPAIDTWLLKMPNYAQHMIHRFVGFSHLDTLSKYCNDNILTSIDNDSVLTYTMPSHLYDKNRETVSIKIVPSENVNRGTLVIGAKIVQQEENMDEVKVIRLMTYRDWEKEK